MATATKNGAKFYSNVKPAGKSYRAVKGNYEITLIPALIDGRTVYFGTLYGYKCPTLRIESVSATWAVGQLARTAQRTAWTDARTFDEVVLPLARDLNEWVKRPERETYNSRGL